MTLTIQLPDDLEQRLRAEVPNLEAEAKEALLIELYRQDKITRPQLSQALGIGRIATDGVLKKHNVTEDMLTFEELEEDFRRAQELFSK